MVASVDFFDKNGNINSFFFDGKFNNFRVLDLWASQKYPYTYYLLEFYKGTSKVL